MMKLSPHFTLDEFCASQTASRKGIDNSLPLELMPNAKRTCEGLERVRIILNASPILISSGYRSPALNKAVGGAKNSQHTQAQAADITAPAFGNPERVVRTLVDNLRDYDQIILEYAENGGGWCHISFTDKPRNQALIVDSKGTRGFV